jgi:ABC-2 type transport system permease protein
MRRIWRLALNDLHLTVRDRPSFIWMLVMPIAFMWLFGNVDGGGSGPPQVSLAVVNQDDGWLSSALIDELTTDQINLVSLTPKQAETAESKVRSLIIPEGFTRDAIGGTQQELRLEKEPGSNEEFSLAAEVHIIRAIVRLVSRLTEIGDLGDPSDAAQAEQARTEYDRLGQRPTLVDLEISTAGKGRPVPRGRAQSVPGMLTFTVMMMTLIYGAVFLTQEKRSGMLRRQAALPLGRRRIFLGKLLGRLLLAAIQIAILVVAGRFIFAISWGDSLLALVLILAAYAFAVGGLSTLLGALARTEGQASSIGWILGMILAGLGGCWWPSEVMPRWLWNAAHVLPTAWAMDGFHALISFGRGLDGVWLPAAALIGFGLLFSILGARFLRFD